MVAFACLKQDSIIDDRVIAAFDAAMLAFEPDRDLIQGMPARRLGEQIEELIATLDRLQIGRVRRTFNWYERFTGLDIKARIEFDLSIRDIHKEMTETVIAADRGRHALQLLKNEFPKLKSIHARQGKLIEETRVCLATRTGDTFHISRLERRLANLEVVHVSNRMAAEQLKLSLTNLTSLLDRFNDIERLLFPLWQQQALMIANAPPTAASKAGSDPLAKFASVHSELSQRLAS